MGEEISDICDTEKQPNLQTGCRLDKTFVIDHARCSFFT
jgi:hypothetical protein